MLKILQIAYIDEYNYIKSFIKIGQKASVVQKLK